MVELVETIAKELVENPDAVVVTYREEGNTLYIELKADQSDLGRLIGKEGRIAKAIRTLVKAAAIKDGIKVIVDII